MWASVFFEILNDRLPSHPRARDLEPVSILTKLSILLGSQIDRNSLNLVSHRSPFVLFTFQPSTVLVIAWQGGAEYSIVLHFAALSTYSSALTPALRVHKGAHRIPDLLCRFEHMPVVQVRIPGRGLHIGVAK